MINNIYKLIIISNLFISPLDANQKIMLDELDVIITPLPLPYNGKEYSVDDLNEFIFQQFKKINNLLLFLELTGVQIVGYFRQR